MLLDSRFIRAAVVGAAFTFAAPIAAQDSSAAVVAAVRTSADSTFSVEQAERGGQVFVRVCVECHERLEMANDDFRLKWGGQTTFDLFKSISTTMPDSDPGILPRGEYLDVVAYILKLNGVPAGVVELAEDSAVMSQAKLHLPLASASGALPKAVPAPGDSGAKIDTTVKADTTALVHAGEASASRRLFLPHARIAAPR